MNEDDKEDLIVEYLARMCWIIIAGLIVAFIITMCSCTRTIYVPQVSVERDSVYITQHSRDSIMVHDSVTVMIKGDTVWKERWRIEYRDRFHTDTTFIAVVDSVPVPYPVEKKLTTMQKAWIKVGKICTTLFMGAIIALIAYLITRKH